jgi:tetratricopeptide (TPR) repeat protein
MRGRTFSSRTRTRSRRSLLPTSEIAAARAALAEAYLRTGDYDAVDRIVDHVLEAARTSGDRRLEADALSVRGMTLHFRAIDLPPPERASIDPRLEESLFEQALALRRELDDTEGIAEALFQLGLVHQVLRRDLDAGAPFVHEALEVVATVPDADVLLRSEIHRHVGFDALLRRERRDEAREHLQASLALRESLEERGLAGVGARRAVAVRAARGSPRASSRARPQIGGDRPGGGAPRALRRRGAGCTGRSGGARARRTSRLAARCSRRL